ncbi:hypothetical protein JCM16138_11310 [Thermococcus atlanticus]
MKEECILTVDDLKQLLIKYSGGGRKFHDELQERKLAVAFVKDWYGDYSTIVLSVEGSPSRGQMLIILSEPFNTESLKEKRYYPLALRGIVIRDHYLSVHAPRVEKFQGCYVDVASFFDDREDIILSNVPVSSEDSFLRETHEYPQRYKIRVDSDGE